MTRTKRPTTTLRRLASVTLVGTTAALTLLVPNTAEASTRVASPDVAAVATQAITALERWQATASVVDHATYLDLRSRAASLTAEGMGLPTAALREAWGSVQIEKQHALLAAVSQLGVPYRSMRSEEGKGFDCSGLVLYAYREAGIELPRSSGDQIREADDIGGFEAEPGDLVYYPGHISMYVGAGLIVHSPYSGSEVEVRQNFDRSVRYGDVFDGSVAYVQPAPVAVGAVRQSPAPSTAGPA